MLFAFYCVLCSTKPECSAKKLLAADPSYCWLYSSKQAIDCFVLFAHLHGVLFSHLECSVEQVLAVDPSACTVGTTCTRGWGEGLNKLHGQIGYLPVF